MPSDLWSASDIKPTLDSIELSADVPKEQAGLRWSLRQQHWLSWLTAPWFLMVFIAWLRLVQGYRFADLGQLRRELNAVRAEIGSAPLLICANHLTLVDSMLINWGLFSYLDYLRHWRLMPWNVPEFGNFGRTLPLRLMSYLGKCIFVRRGGSLRERRQTLVKLQELLKLGQTLCVFPEGTRSRTGRLRDSEPTYSVGELCQAVPNTRVLCLYLRGQTQRGYGSLPRRGETFFVALKLLEPEHLAEGRRVAKDYSLKIMSELITLEDRYAKAYPGPPF